MTNDEQMIRAFTQSRTAAAELIGLWSESLPTDRLAKLQVWLEVGVTVSVLLEDMAATVVLIDQAGGWQKLDRIDFSARAPAELTA